MWTTRRVGWLVAAVLVLILAWGWAAAAGHIPDECTGYGSPTQEACRYLLSLRHGVERAADWVEHHDGIVVAIGTGAIALFTGTLWWTTHRLWQAGEKQIGVAGKTADAAEKSARVAESSLSPFIALCIEESRIEWELAREDGTRVVGYWDDPHIRFHFKNYGRTPAIIGAIKAEFDDGQSPPDPSQIMVSFALGREHIVTEGGVTTTLHTQPKMMTPELKQRLELGFTHLWLYGTVEFDDMFGNEFVSEFCWQYDGPQSVLAPYDGDRKRNQTYRKDGGG